MTTSNLLLAIDVHNAVHSDWHAAGKGCSSITVSRIVEMVKRFNPTHTVACFDSQESFRRALWPQYKADRDEKPEQLLWEIAECWRLLTENGIQCLKVDGFESDDLIATLATAYQGRVIMASTDHDLYPLLVSGRVNQLKKFRVEVQGDLRTPQFYTAAMMEAEYGFPPERYIEYAILCGKTGQWSGAHAIGHVRATQLLGVAPLTQLLADAETIEAACVTPKIRESLIEFRSREPLVRKLATLKTDLPITIHEVRQ